MRQYAFEAHAEHYITTDTFVSGCTRLTWQFEKEKENQLMSLPDQPVVILPTYSSLPQQWTMKLWKELILKFSLNYLTMLQ
jgi:hypothetical protein